MVPGAPSSSVTLAVSTWSSVAVPEIATAVASWTLATADVDVLVAVSAVPRSSVKVTLTVMADPTSDCTRVYVEISEDVVAVHGVDHG